ncbi:hypothetical protein [Bradyrhizobium erythrophlei]|nr:hypothetical protein [Bradyrhizobium erythrophlei]
MKAGTRIRCQPRLAVRIDRPMRKRSERLLLLPLLPIFVLGMFPILLFCFMGFAGLGILGILLICVGLGDGLHANSDFNRQVIVHGYARRSERAVDASNLRWTVRFATVMNVTGVGLIAAGLCGLFYFG